MSSNNLHAQTGESMRASAHSNRRVRDKEPSGEAESGASLDSVGLRSREQLQVYAREQLFHGMNSLPSNHKLNHAIEEKRKSRVTRDNHAVPIWPNTTVKLVASSHEVFWWVGHLPASSAWSRRAPWRPCPLLRRVAEHRPTASRRSYSRCSSSNTSSPP